MRTKFYTRVVKIHKRVLQEVSEKYDGAEDGAEICSQEKLSAEEVIYFHVSFPQSMFPC